jgi:hypothetical protein
MDKETDTLTPNMWVSWVKHARNLQGKDYSKEI